MGNRRRFASRTADPVCDESRRESALPPPSARAGACDAQPRVARSRQIDAHGVHESIERCRQLYRPGTASDESRRPYLMPHVDDPVRLAPLVAFSRGVLVTHHAREATADGAPDVWPRRDDDESSYKALHFGQRPCQCHIIFRQFVEGPPFDRTSLSPQRTVSTTCKTLQSSQLSANQLDDKRI